MKHRVRRTADRHHHRDRVLEGLSGHDPARREIGCDGAREHPRGLGGRIGLFGIHRMYMGKWLTGLVYLCTGGLFLLGYIYDFWTLNDQISLINGGERRS